MPVVRSSARCHASEVGRDHGQEGREPDALRHPARPTSPGACGVKRRKRGTRIFVPREIWDKYLLHGVREAEHAPETSRPLSFRGSKYYYRRLTSRKPV